MQLAGIGNSSTAIVAYLHRAWISCIPSPGKTQLPCASMRAKERAKRAELEPAQLYLGRNFFCGNEPAYVRAPIGNAGQRCIDTNGNLDLKRLPGRVDITRPEKRGIALHAGVSITME